MNECYWYTRDVSKCFCHVIIMIMYVKLSYINTWYKCKSQQYQLGEWIRIIMQRKQKIAVKFAHHVPQ